MREMEKLKDKMEDLQNDLSIVIAKLNFLIINESRHRLILNFGLLLNIWKTSQHFLQILIGINKRHL